MELLIAQLPSLLRRAGILELIHGSFPGRREHRCPEHEKTPAHETLAARAVTGPRFGVIHRICSALLGVREGDRHVGTSSTL